MSRPGALLGNVPAVNRRRSTRFHDSVLAVQRFPSRTTRKGIVSLRSADPCRRMLNLLVALESGMSRSRRRTNGSARTIDRFGSTRSIREPPCAQKRATTSCRGGSPMSCRKKSIRSCESSGGTARDRGKEGSSRRASSRSGTALISVNTGRRGLACALTHPNMVDRSVEPSMYPSSAMAPGGTSCLSDECRGTDRASRTSVSMDAGAVH